MPRRGPALHLAARATRRTESPSRERQRPRVGRTELDPHVGRRRLEFGARPVLVRVWKWYSVRPVVSSNGYSSSGLLGDGSYSAAVQERAAVRLLGAVLLLAERRAGREVLAERLAVARGRC